jgi:outer membrane protein assembly factor BamB
MNKFLIALITCFLFTACSQFSSLKLEGQSEKLAKFKPVWIKNLDPLYESGNLPIALNSPLIYEGMLFVGANSGTMNAYELENGKLVWSESDSSTYHSSPVAYKDQIIYGTVEGRVISRHYTSGKIKFSVDLGASVETKGTIHMGRIFFQLRNHQVFSLDIETGKILWGYKRSVPYLTTLQRASAPVVYKDRVLVGMADGSMCALSLEEGAVLFETKLTTASKFVDVDNTAFVLNDRVYLGAVGGVLNLIDPNTGKVLKKTDFIASRAPYVIPNANGEQLLFGTPNGELVLTDKNLNILSKVKVSSGAITSIVPFKDELAVSSTSNEILLLSAKDFSVIEKFNLGHSYSAIFGELESKNNYLSILTSRNRLFTFH